MTKTVMGHLCAVLMDARKDALILYQLINQANVQTHGKDKMVFVTVVETCALLISTVRLLQSAALMGVSMIA